MYECSICLTLNHASRLHCQCCGTIPAMYSISGRPASSERQSVDVAAAYGSQQHHFVTHVKLRTMPLDYYAE